jgi:hypothetical protein
VLIGGQHGGEQRAALDIRECCASQQKNAILQPGAADGQSTGFSISDKRG